MFSQYWLAALTVEFSHGLPGVEAEAASAAGTHGVSTMIANAIRQAAARFLLVIATIVPRW
jgi:hypothetical protein